MVRFYAVAFQNVGVNRTLRQKFDALLLARLFFKHANEFRADDFALLFGLRNARKLSQKAIDRVHVDQIGVHLIAEHLDDLLGFALAQKPVVDVHAHEVLPDRLDQKRGDDGRIHPAGKRQQHFFVPDLFADKRNLFFDKRIGKRLSCDPFHAFGTNVVFHIDSSVKFGFFVKIILFPLDG